MRPAAAVITSLALLGCRDTIQPELPELAVRIIAPTPADSLFDSDSVWFVGDATADDLGLLPDDSLWWTDNGLEVARGRAVRHRISAGPHVYRLHARYDRRQDSASLATTAFRGIGRILWTAPTAPGDYDGVSLSPSGVLYALGDRVTAHAVSLDGSVRWRSAIGAFVGHPPAIGADGTIYYGHISADDGSRGGLVAVEPNGDRKWLFATGASASRFHVHGGPAIGPDGTIYFVSEEPERVFYAVRPDGTLKWRSPTRTDGSASRFFTHAVLVGDSLVVAVDREPSSDGRPWAGVLVAVAAADGALRWTAFISSTGPPFNQHAPAIGDDATIYVARTSQFVAVRPDGTELWRRNTRMASGSPTIGNNRLYLASANGGATEFTLAGDSVRAFGSPHSAYLSSVTLGANGVLYVAGLDTLYSYDAAGSLRFATPVPHVPQAGSAQGGPVIGPDGNVYLRASELGVVAIRDTVGPATDAPWPMFQGGPMRQGRRVP